MALNRRMMKVTRLTYRQTSLRPGELCFLCCSQMCLWFKHDIITSDVKLQMIALKEKQKAIHPLLQMTGLGRCRGT